MLEHCCLRDMFIDAVDGKNPCGQDPPRLIISDSRAAAPSRVHHEDRDDRRLAGVMRASLRTQDMGDMVEHELQVQVVPAVSATEARPFGHLPISLRV
jgi:hypothetical protein